MKDITITVKRQKTEILYLIISFVLAFCLNILGIVIYKTEWQELYTQLYKVLILGFVIYAILAVFRFIICKTAKIFKKA